MSCTAFNYLFVLQLGWGVEGSALATVCGQAVSCVAVVWYFVFTKNVPLKLHLRYMRPHLRTLGTILSLGLASFAVQAGAAVVNFAINHLLVIYGAASPIGADDALASIGVVQRVGMFTMLPLVGVSIAIQPLLGFNYGAKLIGRVRKTLWYGIAGATVIGTFMWGVVHLWPDAIVSVFGITHPGLVDFTVFALKVQLIMLPLIGFQIVGANYFQATGQPLKSIILSLSRRIHLPAAAAVRAARSAAAHPSAIRGAGRAVLRHADGRLPVRLHHPGVHHRGNAAAEEAGARRDHGQVLAGSGSRPVGKRGLRPRLVRRRSCCFVAFHAARTRRAVSWFLHVLPRR